MGNIEMQIMQYNIFHLIQMKFCSFNKKIQQEKYRHSNYICCYLDNWFLFVEFFLIAVLRFLNTFF